MIRSAMLLAKLVRTAAAVMLTLMLYVGWPSPVGAAPITYEFTVMATDGPLVGVTSTGTFTFDDTVVQPGGGPVAGTDLLTELSFSWDGAIYDETTANTGLLEFQTDGDVTGCFGTSASSGACNIGVWVVGLGEEGAGIFLYTSEGAGAGQGTVRYTRAMSVPEPSTLALLAGASGLWFLRRRRRLSA